MRPEMQDAHAVLHELAAEARRRLPGTVRLEVRKGPGDLGVEADRAHLLTGLVNLVGNALDAMPEGGTLTLSASEARLDRGRRMTDGTQLAPGRYVTLSVADTGAGIPRDRLGRVLEPFYTTKPVGQGAGLGLPMMLGISQDLGGGLHIEPLARGTRVRGVGQTRRRGC